MTKKFVTDMNDRERRHMAADLRAFNKLTTRLAESLEQGDDGRAANYALIWAKVGVELDDRFADLFSGAQVVDIPDTPQSVGETNERRRAE